MAVARQEQSNVMLYTVITFVGLFIVAAILAAVFYIKSEDWRDQFLTSQQQLEELASARQVQNINTLVGQKEGNLSRVGQLTGYIDKIYKISTGRDLPESSAEVKFSELESKYESILSSIPKDFETAMDTNRPGIFRIVALYNNKTKQKDELNSQLNAQVDSLGSALEIARQGAAEREQSLRTQIRSLQEDANSVQQSYNQLRDLMDKKTAEQVQALMQQRDQALEEKNKSRQESLDLMNKLTLTQNRLQDTVSKLEVLKPRPKEDIAAYKPDGRVIAVDTSSNIVFIDIGINDKVYPGLTFSVYDRNAPIPTDGKGKAEIEVYNVAQNTSTARINKSNRRTPLAEDDIIVNLIWDSTATNRFVVAGEFDFDDDGYIDDDGAAKIKQLIENWGGRVEQAVTIDTDFVILGAQPVLKKKPLLNEIESDPMATEKYETSLKESEKYLEIRSQAKDLFIPVFGLKRFLNFIGYESLAIPAKASS